MFAITFKNDGPERTIQYQSPEDFVAVQQLEVPDMEDYYQIVKVTRDDQELQEFAGKKIIDLFNYYNHS